jgi:hypothetical protein
MLSWSQWVSRLGSVAVSHDRVYFSAYGWVGFVGRQMLREPIEESGSPFFSVAALKHVIVGLFVLAEGTKVASGLPPLVRSSAGG